MKKIISLFQRNYDGDRLVRDDVVPGAEWVINGEGRATRKYDGTCCMIRDGVLYKRFEVAPGKIPPVGFEPATDVDSNTGKQQGWLLVGDGPEDQWHREGFRNITEINGWEVKDGTYELCGPKIQGNPEGFAVHHLVPHGYGEFIAFPRTFSEIREAFADPDWQFEGVVWHHLDGRMVKIKVKDFFKKKPQREKATA